MTEPTVSPSRKRMAWTALTVPIFVVFFFLLMLYVFQGRLVWMPYKAVNHTPANIGLSYEDVTLETRDGMNIHGWWVPADSALATILICHGNAGNVGHRLDTIRLFHEWQFNVFIFDYRGYGQSEGSPSEEGTYLDGQAAWEYLTREQQLGADEIVLFGRSLGGGIASWLATQVTPAALILESTFTSVPNVGAEVYPFLPVRLLSRIHYPNSTHIRQINCPVMVIHSPQDDIIPFHHGQKLYELASEPKRFLQISGDHNTGYLMAGNAYRDGILAFVQASMTAGE